jgi:hypothetical protein
MGNQGRIGLRFAIKGYTNPPDPNAAWESVNGLLFREFEPKVPTGNGKAFTAAVFKAPVNLRVEEEEEAEHLKVSALGIFEPPRYSGVQLWVSDTNGELWTLASNPHAVPGDIATYYGPSWTPFPAPAPGVSVEQIVAQSAPESGFFPDSSAALFSIGSDGCIYRCNVSRIAATGLVWTAWEPFAALPFTPVDIAAASLPDGSLAVWSLDSSGLLWYSFGGSDWAKFSFASGAPQFWTLAPQFSGNVLAVAALAGTGGRLQLWIPSQRCEMQSTWMSTTDPGSWAAWSSFQGS